MMDFIYKLYSYDNFTLYLSIVLIALIILFVIVFFFGKKDQKLEETKRLQKIELEKETADTFKEEVREPEKVEVTPTKEEIKEVKEEEFPKIEEQSVIEEPTLEKVSEPDEVNVTVFEPEEKEEEVPEPIVEIAESPKGRDIEEEQVPISLEETQKFNFGKIDDAIEKDLSELENIKNEFNSIEVPNMEITTEEPKEDDKGFQPSQVFSSVFVNKEEEESSEPVIKVEEPKENPEPTLVVQDSEEDDDDFDMPILRIEEPEEKVVETPTVEEKKEVPEEPVNVETTMEEKTEDKVEKEVTPFSFDDLIGETYNIK